VSQGNLACDLMECFLHAIAITASFQTVLVLPLANYLNKSVTIEEQCRCAEYIECRKERVGGVEEGKRIFCFSHLRLN
jgi:hypothetical protein